MTDELRSEPELGDAFGAALLECLEDGVAPGRVFEIVERDDGFISVGDIARYFSLPEGERTDWVLSRLRGRVLDIGAGAGRWALAAQEHGLDVLALDISAGATEVCARRGIRRTFTGTVEELTAVPQGGFDTFLMMGNNLGLLAGPERAPIVLRQLTALANPGARVFAAGLDAEATTVAEHLAYHERNRQRGRMPGQLRIRIRHRLLATPWFDYAMPSLADLDRLLAGSGWRMADSQREGAAYLVELRQCVH